jgi:hypothetical protein
MATGIYAIYEYVIYNHIREPLLQRNTTTHHSTIFTETQSILLIG